MAPLPHQPPPSQSGRWVILVMLSTAIAAALGAWWYQYRQGQRVLELWGPAAARQIRLASQCELWWLQPVSQEDAAAADDGHGEDRLVIGTGKWRVEGHASVASAPGFVHARQALIQDASYRWTTPTVSTARWTHALCFQDDLRRTLLVFDLVDGIVMDADQPRHAAALTDVIATGLRQFFAEQTRAEED